MISYSSEDYVVDSLRNKGFYCSALLQSIRESKIGGDSYELLFMEDEVIRLSDFLILCNYHHFVPFKDDELHPDKKAKSYAITIPLLRVIIETCFRVMYLYGEILRGEAFNKELTRERFQKLVEGLKQQYQVYISDNAEVANVNLPELDGKGRRFDLKGIRDELKESPVNEEDETRLYKFYRYCCFYSHGNLNTGLTAAAEMKCFSEYNINRILEKISLDYLTVVSVVLRDNDLSLKIKDSIEKSIYLKS